MRRLLLLLSVPMLMTGCATTFTGKAKVIGGVAGCEQKCKDWGMELVGMVALGEYTDGCVCKKKDGKLSMKDVGEALILSSSGAGAGAAGVWMQTQAAEQQSHHHAAPR